MRVVSLMIGSLLSLSSALAAAGEFVVRAEWIEDRKAVIATVEPVRQLVARARISGTIVSLKIKEGDQTGAGAELAQVADQKLLIQMQGIDQRIKSLQAQRDKAKSDFDRARELLGGGYTTKVAFEAAKTALETAERNVAAMLAERGVVEQQAAEGAVLSPGAGRILSIPVSIGRVVMAGETIATLAEDRYILRLQLPERHAKFMRAGDVVAIGARGLHPAGDATTEGRVRIVYPEIKGGRVVADVDVEGLGDYFVGERARVYVTTGRREAILAPADVAYRRAGVDYARLRDGTEVVVQLGERRPEGIEILSGLRDGDVVLRP